MEYHWDEKHKFVINAAIKAKRPLLVRGEPGVGKSSLARAAAFNLLERNYISETITARTEPNDLLWQYDGVKRLGDAQILCEKDKKDLDKKNYIAPGVLWWAYQPLEAFKRYEKCPGCCCPSVDLMGQLEEEKKKEKSAAFTSDFIRKGWVVLIDEIDKADSDVPNSLLEAFAENSFTVPHLNSAVELDDGVEQPLIIITTNEDRQLPPAFLRRCFVLHMEIPKGSDGVGWLLDRADVYDDIDVDRESLERIAEIVLKDRENNPGPHKPGLSEFLDFARVLSMSDSRDEKALKETFSFVLQKNAR